MKIMPCSTIDLESYKTEIISFFKNNNSTAIIAVILKDKYNLKVINHTIKSHFQ